MKTLSEALSKSMIKKIEKPDTFGEEYYVVCPLGTMSLIMHKKYKNNIIDNYSAYIYLIKKEEMQKYMTPDNWHHLRIYELEKSYKSFNDLKKDFDINSAIKDLPIQQVWPN